MLVNIEKKGMYYSSWSLMLKYREATRKSANVILLPQANFFSSKLIPFCDSLSEAVLLTSNLSRSSSNMLFNFSTTHDYLLSLSS
jgi:hypothetical protein